MRRAEWRRRADDPEGVLGWWWRGFLVESPLPILLCIVICGLLWTQSKWTGVLAFAIATPLCIVARRFYADHDRSRLRSLLPDPAPEGQFLATVEYRRDGIATGRDEMALTAVEGWLVGEGVRSSFSIRREDVVILKAGLGESLWMILNDGGEVRLLDASVDSRDALARWDRRAHRTEGTPEYPPAAAHPQAVARWASCLVFGAFLCLSSEVLVSWIGSVLSPQGIDHTGAWPILVEKTARSPVALGFQRIGHIGTWPIGLALLLWGVDRLHKLRQAETLAGQVPPLQGVGEGARDVKVR